MPLGGLNRGVSCQEKKKKDNIYPPIEIDRERERATGERQTEWEIDFPNGRGEETDREIDRQIERQIFWAKINFS